jgi:chitinase
MSRYSNIPIIEDLKDNKGARFYATAIYPKVPLSENDIYILTEYNDRLDTLADQFYNNPGLWWIISISNSTLPQNSLHIPAGTQLRIPSNPGQVINLYNKLNS